MTAKAVPAGPVHVLKFRCHETFCGKVAPNRTGGDRRLRYVMLEHAGDTPAGGGPTCADCLAGVKRREVLREVIRRAR